MVTQFKRRVLAAINGHLVSYSKKEKRYICRECKGSSDSRAYFDNSVCGQEYDG